MRPVCALPATQRRGADLFGCMVWYGMVWYRRRSPRNRFDVRRARVYCAELVVALAAVHDAGGGVYRDMKAHNVVLDADGHCVLVDFGLAKVLQFSPCGVTAVVCVV